MAKVDTEFFDAEYMDYKTVNFDDIIAWCKENNQVEWLKAKASETKENGKKISFLEIKKDFYTKFLPDKMPQKKAKSASMLDKLAAL